MDDRETRENAAAAGEARHTVPALASGPAEQFHQDMMVRYLQAMASHSAAAAGEPEAVVEPPHETDRRATAADLQVGDVMKRRSVTAVPANAPLLDVARLLARERAGAVPVVDDTGAVVGVVAESDLLARAASQASPGERPSPFTRLFGRRSRPEDASATAATVMSAPALTAYPWTPVVEAARTAAHSRIRQVFVTDHHGRLVGAVSRSELLHALVRDDTAIREEVVSGVLVEELGLDPEQVEVGVVNGVVTLSGRVPADRIDRLTEAVARIPDVLDVVDHLAAE